MNVALLTEDQCYYVATLSRNTPKVKEYKAWLVKVFSHLRKAETTKKPVTVNDNLDMLEMMINTFRLQQARIETVEEKVAKLEAKREGEIEDYFAVKAYASLKGYKVDNKMAASIGRKSSKLCRDNGYVTGTVPDSRYGKVKTYPVTVLDEIFEDTFKD